MTVYRVLSVYHIKHSQCSNKQIPVIETMFLLGFVLGVRCICLKTWKLYLGPLSLEQVNSSSLIHSYSDFWKRVRKKRGNSKKTTKPQL